MKKKLPSQSKNPVIDETFDLTKKNLQQLGNRMNNMIMQYFETIESQSIVPSKSLSQLKQQLNEPVPQHGMNIKSLLEECQEKIVDNAVRFGHPRFLGWTLCSGTPIGAYADGLAGALNQNVALSGAGAATAVELVVLDWIKQILGYSPRAAGLLTSGGSMANLLALTVARHTCGDDTIRKKGLKKNKQLILYASSEAHVCIDKAVDILGIGTENIHRIKVDERYQMDINDLKKRITQDKAKNLQPFCVVVTAGTVNTGAIDPLGAIADVCKQHHIWFHVDAAYGGFVALSPHHKSLIRGISRADSVAVDPHKWLFIPYDAGCVLVRNPTAMKTTFSSSPEYLFFEPKKTKESDDVDFADYGIELSRSFRALKIWMSLKQYGVKRYAQMIEQNMNLAAYWRTLINESPDFSLEAPSDLSVVCFRYIPEQLTNEKTKKIDVYLNTLNQAILRSMRNDRTMLLSVTSLNGRFVLRACIINFRTTKQDINAIMEGIRKLGKKNDALLRPLHL